MAGPADRELAVDPPLHERRLVEAEQSVVVTLQEEGAIEDGDCEHVLVVLLVSESQPHEHVDEVARERPVARFFFRDAREQRLRDGVDRASGLLSVCRPR